MKDLYPFQCFNRFLLRTPALPFQYISSMLENNDISDEEIMEKWQDEIVREAVFVASPDLFQGLDRLGHGQIMKEDVSKKLIQSFFKYLLRMSFRPTPFGLFAGVNTGSWDDTSHIELHHISQARSHLQIDMHYLYSLSRNLLGNTRIRNQVRFFPNPTAYSVGNTTRYIEYRQSNSIRTHHVVEIQNDPGLDIILSGAAKGKTIAELIHYLVENDYAENNSTAFINDLIDAQVLVPELQATISSTTFLNEIISFLDKLKGTKQKLTSLRKLQTDLQKDPGCAKRLKHFSAMRREIEKLGADYNSKFLYQLDLELPVKTCLIDRKAEEALQKGVRILKALSNRNEPEALQDFRNRFQERFDEDEIPLLYALDPEIGIPYGLGIHQIDPSPLIDDLMLPMQDKPEPDTPRFAQHDFLQMKYEEALNDQKDEIQLLPDEIEELGHAFDDLPPTFNVCFRLLGAEHDSPNIEILWAGGAVASSMIGRFCHMNEDINELANSIVSKEAEFYPDCLLAEIIHLPEERMGNILQRPSLRDYEIPYLSKSTLPRDKQIPAQDLLVSVRNQQVIIRSHRHGKQVIPRLSSAHNYSRNAIPVYRFLCDLQSQGIHDSLSFSWGPLQTKYKSFPRVVFENTVLSPATWRLKKEDIKDPDTWKSEYKMPDWLLLSDFDNELLFTLSNQYSLGILKNLIKGREEFIIKECLFDPMKAIVRSKEGTYNHEIIASFHRL